MKKKVLIASTIALLFIVLHVAGSSMAWFTSSDEEENEFTMGSVEVKVIEENFNPDEETGKEYDKDVSVRSLGDSETYIRVRLIPEWSNPSLSVSNVQINLVNVDTEENNNGDWTEQQKDGYYYYKDYVTTENDTTSKLVESVTFTSISDEYEGANFSLKVVAEGVQARNDAYKEVWGLTELPFDED